MYCKVITAENYSELQKIMAETKAHAAARFAEDKWSAQASTRIAFIGYDAIKRFADEFQAVKMEFAEPMKTDGKTRAMNVPFVWGEYSYYFTREGSNGKFVNFNDWDGIKHLVLFDGILLWPCSTRTATRDFRLFNDETDYRNYLPYDWEKNNPAPNNVGTISDKKMQAWKTWLITRKNAAEENKNQREDKVAAFLERIAEIPASECQKKVVGEYQGEIIRNGLCYSWKIQNGVVYDDLKVDYTTGWRDKKDKLTCFKEMAVGEYFVAI